MTKQCEQCKKTMIQPRWANGNLDSTFKRRRFCSARCYGDWRIALGKATHRSARKVAQRRIPLTVCERCQSTKQLQRHHKDRNTRNNDPRNIEVLCQACHKDEHMKDGTWGLSGLLNRIRRESQPA